MSTQIEPGGGAPQPEAPTLEQRMAFLNPRFAEERFPWAQIWGYAGSLVLTLVALYLVEQHRIAPAALIGVILALAGGQAGLQLGVFMHVRESEGPAWQIIPLALAFGLAIALVGLSMWIMAFKWGVS